jgi:hypothetical protein
MYDCGSKRSLHVKSEGGKSIARPAANVRNFSACDGILYTINWQLKRMRIVYQEIKNYMWHLHLHLQRRGGGIITQQSKRVLVAGRWYPLAFLRLPTCVFSILACRISKSDLACVVRHP